MSIGETIHSFVTGKNKIEREQEHAARKIQRSKELAAYYKEKENQAVLLAQAKAKAEAKAQLRKINNRYAPRPQQTFSAPIGGSSFGSAFGFGGSPTKRNSPTPRFDVFSGGWSGGNVVKKRKHKRKIKRTNRPIIIYR